MNIEGIKQESGEIKRKKKEREGEGRGEGTGEKR